jgi:addiction module RelE/StbE family toxin
MVKIVWTEVSIADLNEIYEYISEDSVRYANLTINRIYQRAQVLSGNPLIGRMVPEINEKQVREILIENYRIIYRLKGTHQLDILRVFHTSRLLRRRNLK